MSPETNALRSLRVLLIDDERLTLKTVFEMLGRLGAEVETHAIVAEVVESVDLTKFDLLISDLHMPIENGQSLIREIRKLPVKRGGRIPAIAIAAIGQNDVMARAIADGYNIYMTKPVEPKELVSTAERLMAAKL